MALPFWRHHRHVEIGPGFDEAEVDGEPVREEEGGTFPHIGREVGGIDLGLMLVGRPHHDDVGPGRRLGIRHDGKAFAHGPVQ